MSAETIKRMLAIDDLTWPVTFRYVAAGGRGMTSWEISVDVPGFDGKVDETKALAVPLFSASIATAICTSVDLVWVDYIIHRNAPGAGILGGGFAGGRRFGTPAPREKSGVLSFNTEHGDKYGKRRHYLYGMPIDWQDENGLTSKGWDGAMGYAHLLTMGLSGHFGAGQMQMLLAYWDVVPRTVGNFYGVAFRRVVSYNVFEHTDKAPELSTDLWPPTGS